MLKDIIVNIDAGKQSDFTVDFAISVAVQFEAHITGVSFLYEPANDSFFNPQFVKRFQKELWSEIEESASAAIARFERAADNAGLSSTSRVLREDLATRQATFGRIARRFDLAVMGQGKPGEILGQNQIIQSALFGSGRPILIVPYIQTERLKLGRTMVCWDGSRAAARALGDAMPFLARSGAVDVVSVADGGPQSDEIPGFDVAAHLARHGMATKLEIVYAASGDVTPSILNRVEDESVDLLVMGGYGHSRLREFVLGGVTRGILNEMTIPVLVSH